MFNVKEAKAEAIKEINAEQLESAKNRYKRKLKEISNAQKIVANLNRELEDLELELSQDA